MGMLVDGRWTLDDGDIRSGDGRFQRSETRFRNWVTDDGSPGPSGKGGFPAEAGRYHLYVSLACPWAHRTLVVRRLKMLERAVSVSVVAPVMRDEGWEFSPDFPDHLAGHSRLFEVYQAADPKVTTRVTVPVLWDKRRGTIVSNESSEIIRMFNSAFDGVGADATVDLYPAPLRREIDAVNDVVYETVNNGVYKAGFATSQQAYEDAVHALFATLDELDRRLSRQPYLTGNRITEADWRLFTTLVRFDAVYVGHFKCNIRRIADYPALSNYLRALYQMPGIAGTVDIPHIKLHYYASHRSVNPTGIVPVGPDLDLDAPHDRDRLRAA
jgi:putative glutathione S-transferase